MPTTTKMSLSHNLLSALESLNLPEGQYLEACNALKQLNEMLKPNTKYKYISSSVQNTNIGFVGLHYVLDVKIVGIGIFENLSRGYTVKKISVILTYSKHSDESSEPSVIEKSIWLDQLRELINSWVHLNGCEKVVVKEQNKHLYSVQYNAWLEMTFSQTKHLETTVERFGVRMNNPSTRFEDDYTLKGFATKTLEDIVENLSDNSYV